MDKQYLVTSGNLGPESGYAAVRSTRGDYSKGLGQLCTPKGNWTKIKQQPKTKPKILIVEINN
jgi:hypothetical protein